MQFIDDCSEEPQRYSTHSICQFVDLVARNFPHLRGLGLLAETVANLPVEALTLLPSTRLKDLAAAVGIANAFE